MIFSLSLRYSLLYSLMKYKPILYITYLWISILCHAQSGKLYTADRELSSSLINKIYQDRNGMIWIATEDGLNRYDGAKFTTYKHEEGNINSLSHSYVRALFEDNQGHLFVGTVNGVQIYDAATDGFSPRAEWENGEIYDTSINSIMQRRSGEVLLSGNEPCIISITPEGKLIVKKLSLPMPWAMIENFFEDKQGNLWIIAGEEGVYRQSATDNRCEHYLKQEGGTPIIDMCQDNQGNIYAASIGHGLFKYDEKTDSFTPIPYKGQHNLLLRSLYLDKGGKIFMGVDGEGLKVYNTLTNEITDGKFENSYFDLSKSKIHSILKDHSGNFWLAIYQKGVMMIPELPNNFKYIGPKSFDKDIIGSYAITALCRDHEGTLWVGTDNDGVYGITNDGKQKAHYAHTQNPASVSPIIVKLYEDSEHNLWFGSYMNGMGKLDRSTGHCTYLTDLRDSGGKRVQRVYCFAEDANKRLWIATMGAGLFYYDLKTDKIHACRLKDDVKVSDWISCLLYSDKDNKLYIGTYDGLFCLDLNSTTFKAESILPYGIIHSIFEDSRGAVWLATSEGLSGWNKKARKITTYNAKDGLPTNVIFAVQAGKQDHLWISTDMGISQFNLETQEFINYYVGDGLQGNEFCKNASFNDENGMLWFGGVNGITYFNPEDIIKPAKKWNVRITDFYLYNKPVRKGMKSGRHEIIDRPVFDAETFRLSHKDNAFSIEFATKELNSPERISYMYSMDGADWVLLRNGINHISFTDLASGTHRFRIRAKDYTLLSDIKEITIVISPAWYASIWARLCYVILFALALYLIISQIRHRYRVHQERLEHKHAEEINEAKLQFFMNISHEIRTPISLIINPLHKLMASDGDPEERQRSYRTISRNSERILQLVNQLMDVRKIDKGQMRLKFSQTDLVDFIKDIYQTYQHQTKTKHIELIFTTECDALDTWIDPKNFDKIILNLLSNALKFTPEGGKIEIRLRTGSDTTAPEALRNYVEIIVSDNGIGINASEKEHIFDRFYQIRNSQNHSNTGAGIGLHLTRSLVELHYGTIRVENNPEGAGSRFIVRLPLGNEHLKPEEIETELEYVTAPVVDEPVLAASASEEDNTKLKSKSKYRVLVVEDDEEIRKYICRELSGDFHMLESANGKEALAIILKKTPNLVISDVRMPEMDGLTLCRKIKQNVNINHVPVILLTSKAHEDDNLEGLSIGADAYMTKPFNIDILKKTAENIIKSRELLRNCFTGSQEQEAKKTIFELQSTDNKLLDRIMNVINRNLSNPELNVEIISSEVGISRVHLYRKLKELTNQSTRDLIRNIRLKHAANLLAYKHYNVTEVASLTGFTSTSLFSRAFKDLYGVSPKDYKAQHSSTESIQQEPADD